MLRCLALICFVLFSVVLLAQRYTLHLSSPSNKIIEQWVAAQPASQDTFAWHDARNELLQELWGSGYLLTEISMWAYQKDSLIVTMDPGLPIHWAQLSFYALDFLPEEMVDQLNFSGKLVSHEKWQSAIREVLLKANENGFLFASYRMEILSLSHDSLRAEIYFNPGRRILLDSVVIEGSAKIESAYLLHLSDLHLGDPVSPSSLRLLREQLSGLKFVRQTADPAISFENDITILTVYLDNREVSSFDLLAGFRPVNEFSPTFSITGYADLDLINAFEKGEEILLHLERLRPRSQEVEIKLAFPFLLNLPFGVEGGFQLLKNDTLYSDLHWNTGVVFSVGRNQELRTGIAQQATNMISINKNQVLSTHMLPDYIDLRTTSLIVGYHRNQLDFIPNPRKGFSMNINSAFSQKKVVRNDLISSLNTVDSSFNYNGLYDQVKSPATRLAIDLSSEYFIPWGTQSTIRLGLDAGWLNSEQLLFSNELYRLGGYARLRGFDEESILAQYYSIWSAEYRLLISAEGYISFFGDYAWTKSVDVQFPVEDHPYGLGIGISFETQAGIFGLRLAAGGRDDSGLDFQNARIHLGYKNRF